eukprot:gene10777-12556_t
MEYSTSINGHIEVIFGPMFSGKSTELLRRIRRYTIAHKKCLVVKYQADTRYSVNNMSTHDKQMWEATPCESLSGIDASEYDIIGIDEGQFFPDLVSFAETMANQGKTVIIAALDGDFRRKPFGNVLELVPLAETVTKLKAVCMICYQDAAFSKRIVSSTQLQLIGGAESYISVCRKCYPTVQCDAAGNSNNTLTNPSSVSCSS